MSSSIHPVSTKASRIARGLLLAPFLTLATSIAALPSGAEAATVFQYGPGNGYVSDNISFERTGAPSGSGPYTVEVGFDKANPLSPSSGYTGPTFYGGYRFSSDSYTLSFDRQGFINDYAKANGNDLIYFNLLGPSGNADFYNTTMQFASVFVFKQDAFNTPFQSGDVTVNGFSISIFKHANGLASTQFKPEGRWLVEVGGTYYLSNQTFTNTVNESYATFELSGNDLQTTLWAAYDPSGDILFDSSSANFQPLTLEGVTSVGFYIDETSFKTTSGTVGMRLGIGAFSVTSTAIPEPGTLTFIGVSIPLLLGYFLRR